MFINFASQSIWTWSFHWRSKQNYCPPHVTLCRKLHFVCRPFNPIPLAAVAQLQNVAIPKQPHLQGETRIPLSWNALYNNGPMARFM
jgi:hypothetical protein